jgi:hypothetical protein
MILDAWRTDRTLEDETWIQAVALLKDYALAEKLRKIP